MTGAQLVLAKIAGMSVVILGGWVARRRGALTGPVTATISRLVVDVAFPALVFTQMIRTVDAAALRKEWLLPLLPLAVVAVAAVAGLAVAPFCAASRERRTVLFLVVSPNWVFLPLPIAEALYGAAGVRVVLLCNVGAQLTLWLVGVSVLHGTVKGAARSLATNVGLWATAGGIAASVVFPGLRLLADPRTAGTSPAALALSALLDAVGMVGSVTIPLSLLAIGAQLGALPLSALRPTRPLAGTLAARLVAAPLATVGLMALAGRAGLQLAEVPRTVTVLLASMPVALVCSVMAERYGGDVDLSAQAVFVSTLLSIATVPALFLLAG